MDVKVKDAESCVKTVTIVVSEEEVEKEYQSLFDEFKNDIVIPGFRKGKFPRKLFERKYADTIEKDVKGRIKENYVEKALEQEKIEYVIPPKVEENEFDRKKPFQIDVKVEVKPEFSIPDIKQIKLTKEEHSVTDEMLEEQITMLRERRREYKPKKENKVEEGDRLKVDYTVHVDGEEVDSVENGSLFAEEGGSFLGTVEDYPAKVTGKKKGSKVTLHTTLPAYFKEKQYQGKKAEIKLVIKDIDAKILPDPDSKEFLDFCKAESLEDLKKKITEELSQAFDQAEESRLFAQIYDYFDEHTDFNVPPTLFMEQVASQKSRKTSELKSQNKSDEEIDKELEASASEIEQQAKRTIKNYFILQKLSEENTIVATEDEINQRIMSIAIQQRVTPADMRQHLERMGGIENIRGNIREEKTLQFIINKADVAVKKANKPKAASSSKSKSASGKKKAAKKKPSKKKTESKTAAKKESPKKKSTKKKTAAKKKSAPKAKKKKE